LGGSELFCETLVSVVPAQDSVFPPRLLFFFFGVLISFAILHFLIRMDMEIVVLLQLAAGSMQWHEAGHGVGSGGKGESLAGGAASRC